MKTTITLLAPSLFLFCLHNLSAQGYSGRLTLGKKFAEKELSKALSDYTLTTSPDIDTIIKDSITAVNIAEPILFSKYGKNQIISERPYEVYSINNYWVISGTLPKGYKGGGFLIILDAWDSKVIRLIHYK